MVVGLLIRVPANELEHRRRAAIADDIAAGRRPAAARTDEQGE